ncbi:hypothetical protein [Halalkalibacter okhensis]|uniref:Uncharacterized protein n=1 Tax=Halalkalibacter okhensis TaxID=333138 RepID=A0A0B0IAQ2_9BACI|nr:hypothetical protein [Halalkalibacter okhensis]KHF37902.1 hypothetical protein LQ50_24670 [Halalkalibacter okhensis]
MSIDFDSLVPFFIMWGIPIFMVIRTYLKMNVDDRKSAKSDFKTPRFIFTIGFTIVGIFIAQIGSILRTEIVNTIGIIILAIGGMVSVVDTWRKNRFRSILISLLIMFAIYFLYG